MRQPTLWLVPILLLAAPSQDEPVPIRGFSPEAAKIQRVWENKLRAIPVPDSMRSYLKRLTARPQHLGSPYGKANAEWLVAVYRSWGLDARIETFDVLFPTPKVRLVELVAPTRFVAKLAEPPVAGDASSAQQSERLPPYNVYSIDGDVTGPLVYVNYGVPADYEELERRGISVKGAIVIARYGGGWRGTKPKVAAEHGAIGCLIYSDPADDGYAQGDVYPKGPYRPADGVQMGSVVDIPVYPGDPSTPGRGSVPGVTPVPIDQMVTLTKIPVLPISYGDALPLLSALGGETVPPSWRGALPITYKTGLPGPARVHLKLAFNWTRVPLHNVITTIPGEGAPDEWILRGNHRDGWVHGASDPLSSLVAEMEELRGMAELVKQGWRPRRTIIYMAWDGEEEGIIGSTEWVETHLDELKRKAVVYINTDTNGRGYLGMDGSHSLERFINEVAREIVDPETGLSAWKRAQFRRIAEGSPDQREEARRRRDLRIGALGSGSDYSPFLQHAGLAAMNIGFGGEGGDGLYHSMYDTFERFIRFNDTSFVYAKALAQTIGTAIIRLASAEVLPFQFTNMADTYRIYLEEVKALAASRRIEIGERNRQIEEGLFAATTDPRTPRRPPAHQPVPGFFNFAPLENAMTALDQAADRYESALAKPRAGGPRAEVNRLLRQVEAALTSESGLPRRSWYRHLVYAPGYYTGYGVKTLPGIREGLEQGYWDEAEREIGRVAERLGAAAKLIEEAAAKL
ncbi:MAG: transferrin receptor-like dimerization domain-containing protein [Gemmatimonadales bacterium]